MTADDASTRVRILREMFIDLVATAVERLVEISEPTSDLRVEGVGFLLAEKAYVRSPIRVEFIEKALERIVNALLTSSVCAVRRS